PSDVDIGVGVHRDASAIVKAGTAEVGAIDQTQDARAGVEVQLGHKDMDYRISQRLVGARRGEVGGRRVPGDVGVTVGVHRDAGAAEVGAVDQAQSANAQDARAGVEVQFGHEDMGNPIGQRLVGVGVHGGEVGGPRGPGDVDVLAGVHRDASASLTYDAVAGAA